MSEWKELRLGDVCEKIGSGATPKGGKEAYHKEGITLIRSQNILDFKFTTNGLAFIDEDQAKKLNNVTVEDEDILLNITGDSVARCCLMDKQYIPARVNQHVSIIRANKEKASCWYILYFLQRNKDTLLQLASGGATRNALTKSMIENLDIPLPPLETQKKIASVLSALDEKIELNNKINNDLEDMAQAIFKNWFVETQYQETEIAKLVEVKDGTHDSPKNNKIGFPLVTSKHLYEFGVDLESPNRISFEDFSKINTRSKVDSGDILLSMIGTVGLVSLVIEKEINFAIKNVALLKTSNSEDYKYFFLCYLKSAKGQQEIEKKIAGSTQKYISLGELRSMPIICPSSEKLTEFNKAVYPIFDNIISLVQENQRLSQLRDTLLPRLMSGEINVENVVVS